MKRIAVFLLSLSAMAIGLIGCADKDKSTMKTETKVSTPGGETTTTTEKDIKQTGQNPPAARP